MPKPDVRDDAFLREVDDEYRRSQVEGFGRRYGRAIAIGVVVLLVALGALLYWREDRAKRAGLTGEAFNLALTRIEAGNFAAAAPVIAHLAKSGSPGYAALARLMEAATAVQSSDTAKGLALYHAIADDAAVAKPFRDLALVKATRLEFDTLPPATVVARLRPFSVPGDPWFGVAAEMSAIADLKLGKPDLAAPLFAAIVRDPAAPPSIRNRAAQLAVSLGTDPATLLAAKPPLASKPLPAGNAK